MPRTAIVSAYNFSDAELKQRANTLLRTIRRDLNKCAPYHIHKSSLVGFKELITAFADASTEEELQHICKKAAEAKQNTTKILLRLLQSICNMAELAFEGKGHFNSFGFEGMAEMKDNELLVLAQRVHKLAASLMPELKPQGLLESHLEALTSFVHELDAKIEACKQAVKKSDRETQYRLQKGNMLYAEVLRLGDISKSFFEAVDDTRYSEYAKVGGNIGKPAKAAAQKADLAVR